MAYSQKKYNRINWKNRPSTATALGATNLNKMDVFLNDVDNALMAMETAKLDKTTANTMIKSVEYTAETGKWVFTELNGTKHEFDQNIEKIPTKFELKADGKLVMTTTDGLTYEADIANAIKAYDFQDTDTIDFTKTDPANVNDLTKQGTFTIKAIVKEGSIEGKHLKPDYKVEIDGLKNDAESAAADSLQYSKDAKRYAVGDAGTVPDSATDNAKYYCEQAKASEENAKKSEEKVMEIAGTDVVTMLDAFDTLKKDMALVFVDIDLKASGWQGQEAPFTQSVMNEAINEQDVFLVKAPLDSLTADAVQKYDKAFRIITQGTAETHLGSVSFSVLQKPEADITVRLIMRGADAEDAVPDPENAALDASDLQIADKNGLVVEAGQKTVLQELLNAVSNRLLNVFEEEAEDSDPIVEGVD